MKVAITGSHGVGKSTLTKYLEERLIEADRRVSRIQEVPRFICEKLEDPEFFKRDRNSLLKQTLIMLGQVIEEGQASADIDIQLCDRSIFDHWAYTAHSFQHQLDELHLNEIYLYYVVLHAQSYAKIFYVPIEFEVVDDGVREADLAFQKAIDATLVSLFDKYGIPTQTVSGTVEERARPILKYINSTNPTKKLNHDETD